MLAVQFGECNICIAVGEHEAICFQDSGKETSGVVVGKVSQHLFPRRSGEYGEANKRLHFVRAKAAVAFLGLCATLSNKRVGRIY